MFAERNGEQVLDLLLCGGFGVAVGLWLDALTLLTPRKTPKWVAAVRDAAAVVIAAVGLFLLSLTLPAGRLRRYLFAGAGLGLWAYRATLHRFVCAVGDRVRRWLGRATDGLTRWNDRTWRRPLRQKGLDPLCRLHFPHRRISSFFQKTFKKRLKSADHPLYNNDE